MAGICNKPNRLKKTLEVQRVVMILNVDRPPASIDTRYMHKDYKCFQYEYLNNLCDTTLS